MTSDPDAPARPFVYSFGPNAKDEQGGGDDLTSRGPKHAPGPAKRVDPLTAVEQELADRDAELARTDLERLLDACKLYAIQNRGRLPTWQDLIAKDRRGLAFLDRNEPKRDPWGQEYVIGADPDYASKPFVYSRGPNGVDEKGQGDDVSNRNLIRRR